MPRLTGAAFVFQTVENLICVCYNLKKCPLCGCGRGSMWIDITQELFSSEVYPGDTPPEFRRVSTVEKDGCMVTDITMCAHNGTHIDAPAHFLSGGRTVDRLDLSRCAGTCEVRTFSKVLTAEDAEKITAKRLLLRGDCSVSAEAANILRKKLLLLGIQAQSVGDAAVHKSLLSADVILLEGLVLQDVEDGAYELFAFPLKLGGCDGAPVRAVLRKICD